jgi:hypothetical protein
MFHYDKDLMLWTYQSNGILGVGKSRTQAEQDWYVQQVYESLDIGGPADDEMTLLRKAALSNGQP